jgi:hypothetical protein
VIVGNKLDQAESPGRAVSVDEGQSLASEFGAGFIEVSV